jgi:exodeoxyribonuclease V alpha subunit
MHTPDVAVAILDNKVNTSDPRKLPADTKPHTLSVTVQAVLFANTDTGFTVATASVDSDNRWIRAIGTFKSIAAGDKLDLTGFWHEHRVHGPQFRVLHSQPTRPTTLAGLERYLASGLLKGIGPVTARQIIEAFGEHTVEVLDKQPDKLSQLPGIGAKRLAQIKSGWLEQRAVKDVVVFFREHGISTNLALRVLRKYGDHAIPTLTADPYQLARDIFGVGFHTADQVALKLGIAPQSPERIRAALRHVLEVAAQQGHTFLPARRLLIEAAALLAIPSALVVEQVLRGEIDLGVFISDDFAPAAADAQPSLPSPGVYLPSLYEAETSTALLIKRLALSFSSEVPSSLSEYLDRYCRDHRIELSTEQREAVQVGAHTRLMVITGGPGTGKTTTLNAIVAWLRFRRRRVLLAAPTGRAAQRLTEITSMPAGTVHRLLAFSSSTNSFTYNDENPLPADVVIVDESSMLDIGLACSLLSAIGDANLILVGDVDQLPAVGPGTFLKDLIDSGSVPVVRLTHIFRQARQSLIVANAHRIRSGALPELVPPGHDNVDCYFVERPDPASVASAIVNMVSRSLPDKRGFSPLEIQVLCPMNKGICGTFALNSRLQEALNPKSPEKPEIGHQRIFRLGDKVIQRRNDYLKDIFNGDIGTIDHISLEEQALSVSFSGRRVEYGLTELADLAHAYALTIHKGQGSEYPAVIIPLHTEHYMLLGRQLLYTAITRAQRLCVLAGSRQAIATAVRRADPSRRFSMLTPRILSPTFP